MPYLRFEDDESSVTGTVTSVLLGAVAGFAVGMLVAQRVGGFSGLADKIRRRRADEDETEASAPAVADDFSEYDEEYDELEDEGVPNEGLEERVLEAFRNDPILSERAIDIGGIGEDTIELAGWVNTEEEAEHAVVLARGVPGVETVVNRIAIGDLEQRIRAVLPIKQYVTPGIAQYEQMMAEGWNLNSVGEDQENAVTTAIDRDDPELLRWLLQHGVGVSAEARKRSVYHPLSFTALQQTAR